MNNSGEDFRRTVRQWVEQRQGALQAVARQSIQEMSESVIENTRVDTGNLRKQWQPSLNAPALTMAPDQSDPATTLSMMLATMPAGAIFYMSNNAAYALRMEYGFVGPDSLGRYYNQKGDYNVQSHVTRWPAFVARAAQENGFGL